MQKLNNKRLQRAYRLSGIAWWELDIATQTYTSSNEIFEIYGLPVPANNQNTVEEFLSFVHPEDVPRLQQDLTTLDCDEFFNYEHRIVKPNGEVVYLTHFSELIRDDAGKPVALHGVAKDITKDKLYQHQLEASEKKSHQYSQQLAAILESIGDGFFSVDKWWRITYWNKRAETLLQKKREDILGKNLWQEYREATQLKFYSESSRAMREGVWVHFEEHLPSLGMWFEVNAYPSAEGLSVFFKNITERKEQELELKISNERFEFVSKATSDAIWDWDIINNTNYFNEAFSTFFGHTRETLALSDSWSDHIHEEDREMVLKSVEAAVANPEQHNWAGEYRFHRADGSVAYVYDRATIIRDETGKAVRMVGAMQDISRIKEAEQAITRAIIETQEKERSEIGKELHDNVNQILTTVKLYIENIKNYPEHSAVFIEKGVQLAQRAINEIRFLAKQLVTPVMADLGLEATITEMIEHYKALNLFEISLLYQICEEALDKGLQLTIYRIIQEQLNNVVKYAKASQVKVVISKAGDVIRVEVEDNGMGFDIRQKASRGSGLNNIAFRSEAFKGKVRIDTAVGKGCCLSVEFPTSGPEAAAY